MSILLISHIPVISRAFSYLGRYSANIFLVHTLIYCYYFPEFIYSFASAGWWLSLIVLVLVSFGVSVLMEWIKKVTRYDKMMSAAGNKILGIICEVFK